jgi:hypothetical protein
MMSLSITASYMPKTRHSNLPNSLSEFLLACAARLFRRFIAAIGAISAAVGQDERAVISKTIRAEKLSCCELNGSRAALVLVVRFSM